MKHNELLEYSTVIQLMRMQITGLKDCLYNLRELIRSGDWTAEQLLELSDRQMAIAEMRRIDFSEVVPERENEG